MKEQIHHQITQADLSPATREEFENLIAQLREIMGEYGVDTIRGFVDANPPKEILKQAVELMAEMKRIKQQEKNKKEIMRKFGYKEIGDFVEGRAVVHAGYVTGVPPHTGWSETFHIKPDGTPLYTMKFHEVLPFKDGLAKVKKGARWMLIKHDGTMLKVKGVDGNPIVFSDGETLVGFHHIGEFVDGVTRVKLGGLKGYLKTDGIFIPD